MVEWNRIFRLFRFSGILGQPREVHPKFRNEIPENVCSIRSPTGISGIFGRMKAPLDSYRQPGKLANQIARSVAIVVKIDGYDENIHNLSIGYSMASHGKPLDSVA